MEITLVDDKGNKVDLSKENPDKPWVFIFSGKNLSPASHDGKMEIVLRNARNSIEGMKRRLEYTGAEISDCRFFAAYYDKAQTQDAVEYNRDGKVNSGVEKVAAEIVRAKICDLSGKVHRPQLAAAGMGGVMFYGHCYGGMVVSALEKALERQLEAKGLVSRAREEVLKAPKAVLVNPPVLIDKLPRYFDTFSMINCSDYILQSKPEYQGVAADLLKYGNFDKKQLFHYDDNPRKWKIPEDYKMRYLKVKGANELRMLMVNSMEVPEEEMVDKKIQADIGISRQQVEAESINENLSEKYFNLQKKYAGGHELSCIIKPLNLYNSEFMQKLQGVYLNQSAAQFVKTKEAQQQLNTARRRLSIGQLMQGRNVRPG